MPAEFLLSKSSLMRGQQCGKSLYLHVHHPELRSRPSETQHMMFEKGQQVGKLARNLFPNGRDVSPPQSFQYALGLRMTEEAVAKKVPSVLYEAAFVHEEVYIAADILYWENGGWHVVEVKSSTSVSDNHVQDAAIQYHVMKGRGLDIHSFSLLTIRSDYTRKGALDLGRLFRRTDITRRVEALQEEVAQRIVRAKSLLREAFPPKVDIGAHCQNPYECDFKAWCWQHIPAYSVFDINGLAGPERFDLYQQGYVTLDQIPADYPLHTRQRQQVEVERTGLPLIQEGPIRKFVQGLAGPLYFLDFESFQPAVPPFDHCRPYQQIPFQYSLHYWDREQEPEHSDYLALPGQDPRRALAQQLVQDTQRPGLVIVFNMAYERDRIGEMAALYPDLRQDLLRLLDRLRDLMQPFSQRWYVHPLMRGSNSIKRVLPALVPRLSYEGLEIGEGSQATARYERIWQGEDPEPQRTMQALREYCQLDTLAMVEILKVLERV